MLRLAKILKDNKIKPSTLQFELKINSINIKLKTKKEIKGINNRPTTIKLNELYVIRDYLVKRNIIPQDYDTGALLDEI